MHSLLKSMIEKASPLRTVVQPFIKLCVLLLTPMPL